jgi:hypothetical protein
MPMRYPDLSSLLRLGEMLKIPRNGDEPEDLYRGRLAQEMEKKGDFVWAHEIRTGAGWDEWSVQEKRSLKLPGGGRLGTLVDDLAGEDK